MPCKRDKNKVKAVARVYVRNGFKSVTKALKEVEGDIPYKHSGWLAVKAHKLKFSPEYMEAVRQEIARFDKSIVNEAYVVGKLFELIEAKDIKPSDKTNALSLVAKILQLTKENTGNNTAILLGDITSELRKVITVKSMPTTEPTVEPPPVINDVTPPTA